MRNLSRIARRHAERRGQDIGSSTLRPEARCRQPHAGISGLARAKKIGADSARIAFMISPFACFSYCLTGCHIARGIAMMIEKNFLMSNFRLRLACDGCHGVTASSGMIGVIAGAIGGRWLSMRKVRSDLGNPDGLCLPPITRPACPPSSCHDADVGCPALR